MGNTVGIQEHITAFRKELERGSIQRAYRGIIDYILDLRTSLARKYPDYYLSGVYQGYMNMTYFSFNSKTLREHRLKVVIVFVYDSFRFEVWLAGQNREVQEKYWGFFKESGWDMYRLVSSIKGADSIVEHVLVEDPDFSDPNALTKRIEVEVLRFIGDVEGFLYKRDFGRD